MFRFFRYIALLVGIAAALPAAAKEELSPAQQRKFDYYFYEGLKLKQDGKYDAAYDLFNYCLEIDSTAAPVLYELSSFYVQMDKADRAVEMLRRRQKDYAGIENLSTARARAIAALAADFLNVECSEAILCHVPIRRF